MTDKEFWKGVEGSYKRLNYLAVSMAAIAAVMYFM